MREPPKEMLGRGVEAAPGARTIALISGFLVASYLTLLADTGTFDGLLQEDGPVETIGAMALLCAGALFLIAFARSGSPDRGTEDHFVKRLALLALVLLCFVGAGEEISWGQRLLGYGTPEAIRSANAQGELNVHNLFGVESWFGYVASAFWAAFAVLLPLASALYEPARRFFARYLPIYPASLALLFVANYALGYLAREVVSSAGLYNGSEPIANTVLEIREMTVAVLFALGALYVVWALPPAGMQHRPSSGPREHHDPASGRRPAR